MYIDKRNEIALENLRGTSRLLRGASGLIVRCDKCVWLIRNTLLAIKNSTKRSPSKLRPKLHRSNDPVLKSAEEVDWRMKTICDTTSNAWWNGNLLLNAVYPRAFCFFSGCNVHQSGRCTGVQIHLSARLQLVVWSCWNLTDIKINMK